MHLVDISQAIQAEPREEHAIFCGTVRAQEGGREVNKLTANEKFGPDFAHVWVTHGGVIHKEKKLVEKLVEMEF